MAWLHGGRSLAWPGDVFHTADLTCNAHVGTITSHGPLAMTSGHATGLRRSPDGLRAMHSPVPAAVAAGSADC